MNTSCGFVSLIVLVAVVAGIAVLGGAGWWASQQKEVKGSTISVTGVFQGYDSAFTSENEKYLIGYIDAGENSYFIDLRPLIGYELTNASLKLGIKVGDTVTATLRRNSDGPLEAVTLTKSASAKDSCGGRDPMKPYITAITPTAGPVGTKVTIEGCNLSGFEGDLEATFERSDGKVIPLYGGTYYRKTPNVAEITRMTLTADTYCPSGSIVGRYSGVDTTCAPVEANPGLYKVYVQTPEGTSNTVTFTVKK